MKYLLLSALLFLISSVSFAQNEDYSNYRLVVLGEMHFLQEETSKVQLEIIGADSSKMSFNLFLELSPDLAYYLNRYLESGDESYLINDALRFNHKSLIDSLRNRKFRGNIIGLDIPSRKEFKYSLNYFQSIAHNFSTDLEKELLKMSSIKRPRQFRNMMTELLKSNSFLQEANSRMAKTHKYNLLDFMESVSNYGFIRNARSKKKSRLRESNFTLVLNKYVHDEKFNVVTIGRSHLIESQKKSSICWIENVTVNRDELLLGAIVYPYYPWILYKGDYYSGSDSLNKFLDMGIVDQLFWVQ